MVILLLVPVCPYVTPVATRHAYVTRAQLARPMNASWASRPNGDCMTLQRLNHNYGRRKHE